MHAPRQWVLAAAAVGLSLTQFAAGGTGSPVARMVLQLSDLPPHAFVGDWQNQPNVPDAVATYVRKYEQAPDQGGSFTGITSLNSGANLFPSPTLATEAFSAFSTAAVTRPPKAAKVPSSRVGNESGLFHIAYYSGGFHWEVYTLVWRDGPVEAFIQAQGLDATVNPGQVVSLAQKQEARVHGVLRGR